MKIERIKRFFLVVGLIFSMDSAKANETALRATEISSQKWAEIMKGNSAEALIEFRQGDEIPVVIEASGDLMETKKAAINYVAVKRTFWLRIFQKNIEMSLDKTTFQKFDQVLSGSLEVGTVNSESAGHADALNVVLKSFLK